MSFILAAGAARMKLEAENYEARIAALEAQLAEPKVTEEMIEAALKAFHSVGRYASEKARMEAALTAAQEARK